MRRYTEDEFLGPDEAAATIGVDYRLKSIQVHGKWFKLSIWDTAGQERYRTLTSGYYRGAQGVVLGASTRSRSLTAVYDVTNRESFDAIPSWIKESDMFATQPELVRLLIGNKVDREAARVVSSDEGAQLAKQHGSLFLECSAKEGTGVESAFTDLVSEVSVRVGGMLTADRVYAEPMAASGSWRAEARRQDPRRRAVAVRHDHAAGGEQVRWRQAHRCARELQLLITTAPAS